MQGMTWISNRPKVLDIPGLRQHKNKYTHYSQISLSYHNMNLSDCCLSILFFDNNH